MKIGIIGAGSVGSGLAKRLLGAGHSVCLSYSRDRAKLNALAESLGPGAQSGTPSEAAQWSDVVLLAVTWGQVTDALNQAGNAINGKILWTTVNALKPDMSGMAIGTTTSAAEEIAALLPQAVVVEAISCNAEILHAPTLDFPVPGASKSDRPNVFVCGDDANARATVAQLVEDIGLVATDAGPLTSARLVEPAGFLIAYLAYGLGRGGANVAMKVLTR